MLTNSIQIPTRIQWTGKVCPSSGWECLSSKPLPWTLIWPLICEWELSNHHDKAFVEQLIDNLLHGCIIGYSGPQFAHSVNHLASTSQKPDEHDASFCRECKAGRILGPFSSPPLPNFRTSGLGFVLMNSLHWPSVCKTPQLFIRGLGSGVSSWLLIFSWSNTMGQYVHDGIVRT